MSYYTAANRAWILLLLATGLTWWLGESGMAESASVPAAFLMLGLALVKGVLVIYDFMELRHAPRMWKLLIVGWLAFVLSMIALAYWTGLR